MLDFKALKEIRLTDVCAKYGIALTFAGKYAKAKCPLPMHKPGDRDKNFNINLEGNFWKCWSGTCNENAGAKGGDVINFVALMENCSQHAAAQKLADWFHIHQAGDDVRHGAGGGRHGTGAGQIKSARHIAERGSKQPSKGTESKLTVPSVEVKGYMADVDAWFDDMIRRGEGEADAAYLHRIRNAVKARLVLSFRNGKRVAQGLLPES